MHRFRLLLTGVIFTIVACVGIPIQAQAATADFFGPLISDACTCPGVHAPSFGCVLDTIQRAMNLGISLSILIAVLVLTYAGILFLLSPTNPESKTKARTILTNGVVGFIIVIAAWLIVDFVMKLFYGGQFGPWNQILNGGATCIDAVQTQSLFAGSNVTAVPGSTTTAGAGGSNVPLSNTGRGACSATDIFNAASTGGVRMSSQEANIISCVAGPESGCGTLMQNYNWNAAHSPPPSTAWGPFQITLKGNSRCFDNSVCEQVAGVSGPLNCASAFTSSGYSIPGPTLQRCQLAAANLNCSSVAADCVYNSQGPHAWTADPHNTQQQACITANGGS